MRRLILELFLLLAFMGVVYGLLEWRYRDYSIGLDGQYAQFRMEQTQAEVLFLGNSHIIPLKAASDSMRKVRSASLAFVGMDLFWTKVLLNRQQDALPRLKEVILYADPEILGYNQTLHGQAWINRALYRYGDTLYNDRLSDRWMARSNFFRSNRDLSYLFKERNGSAELPIVRDRLSLPLDDTIACKVRAIENSRSRFDERLFPENLRYLNTILDCCKQHGWQVTLVRTPKRSAFLRYFEHAGIERARLKLDSLAKARGLFLFEPGWSAEDDRLIADPDHLLLDGAKRFLEELDSAKEHHARESGMGNPDSISFSMTTGK